MGCQFSGFSEKSREHEKAIRAFAAAVLGMAFTAAVCAAGDLSSQSADALNVTNSSAKLLPQDQAAESSWLRGLHVSGYASQTFGMWQNRRRCGISHRAATIWRCLAHCFK